MKAMQCSLPSQKCCSTSCVVTLLTAQGDAIVEYHSGWISCATPFMSQVLGVLFSPGGLEVAAELSTKNRDAAGSVDFVVWLNSFVISMLEVRMLFCHSDAI